MKPEKFITMRKLYFLFIASLIAQATVAQQKHQQFSIAFSNNAPAKPFDKFAGFFTENFHPGIEAGYSFSLAAAKKHEWFQGIRAGYFYHRFVQHGISLYTDFGYSYKFNRHISANASLGLGTMLSIPETANLVLNDKGEYEFNSDASRLQAIVPFSIAANYTVNPSAKKPVQLFSKYQQKVQFGFINEYVPILPYSSLSVGCAWQL